MEYILATVCMMVAFVLAWFLVCAVAIWIGTRQKVIKALVRWSNDITEMIMEEIEEEDP